MDNNLQLSILLPFQNQRDAVEKTLTPLFELESINFELFIIDDASTDGTGQAIYSLLDYYEHEQTYFYEHTKPAGRGNCLSQLIREVNTDLVWIIDTLEDVDEEALKNAIQSLTHSKAQCLAQQFTHPVDNDAWLEVLAEKSYPSDGQFLWNLNNIASTDQFFSPYINRYHGFEWLIRLDKVDIIPSYNKFYHPLQTDQNKVPDAFERREMMVAMLRHPTLPKDIHQQIAEYLKEKPKTAPRKPDAELEYDLLEKAVSLTREGQLIEALDYVEQILENESSNEKAKRLKIQILERKRRFVEASELKHELNIEESEGSKVHADVHDEQVKTSIIIPTALYGKPALENCLMSVTEYCDPVTNELVIIDNASLDDTYDYLEELKEKNFFNCKIITNQKNRGFAASVNQGFEEATGEYYCLLHNDVEFESRVIAELTQLMDDNPDYALMGPLTDSTLNPDQLIGNQPEDGEALIETDYLDSFLMMVRAETEPRMDEQFTLAFFDDIDLSFQLRNDGYQVGIAANVSVTHHYGNTTFALDLDTDSKLYWKNVAFFNEKWDIESFSAEQLQGKDGLEQLLLLDQWVNPIYPEQAICNTFEELFTSELKTQILKSDHEPETLQRLTHLFMVMDERDTMRRLEDRLTKPDLPVTFIYELVRFYFDRNIYSRCTHYLNRLTTQQQSLQSALYKLAILIDEKKIDEAIPQLTELLDKAPSNPLLYKLAGDIYRFKNDREEAKSFYQLAEQINPFRFGREKREA